MQFQWPMTRRHPFAWLAVAGLVLLLASTISACADLPPLGEVPLPMGEAYQSPEGLIVRPQAVGDEDWADILGIKRWRFDLQGVAPDTELRFQLEIRLPNQTPAGTLESPSIPGDVLTAFSTVPREGSPDDSALIALHPVDNDFYHAANLQYYVGSEGASTAGVAENPFQGWSAFRTNQPAELLKDGVYELMVFSRDGSFLDPDNARVVLSISTSRQ